MLYYTGRLLAALVAGLLIPAGLVQAGGHGKHDDCGPKTLHCYTWKLCEITETVYDVTYKEEKKKIQQPVIKEIKRPISCKVCKPFEQIVMKNVPVTDYCRTIDNVTKCEKKTCTDECGKCHDVCENVTELMTCIVKSTVCQQIPVRQWVMIPVEHKYEEKYLVRECEEKEVVIKTPVLTPRTITRKVWTKVPYCPPKDKCGHCNSVGCNHCTASH